MGGLFYIIYTSWFLSKNRLLRPHEEKGDSPNERRWKRLQIGSFDKIIPSMSLP